METKGRTNWQNWPLGPNILVRNRQCLSHPKSSNLLSRSGPNLGTLADGKETQKVKIQEGFYPSP